MARDEEVEASGHPLRGLLAELAAQATLLPLAGLSAPEMAALMVLDAVRPGGATDGAPQVGVAASAPLRYEESVWLIESPAVMTTL